MKAPRWNTLTTVCKLQRKRIFYRSNGASLTLNTNLTSQRWMVYITSREMTPVSTIVINPIPAHILDWYTFDISGCSFQPTPILILDVTTITRWTVDVPCISFRDWCLLMFKVTCAIRVLFEQIYDRLSDGNYVLLLKSMVLFGSFVVIYAC